MFHHLVGLFGCHFFYFPILIGLLSSSHLTFIFFRGVTKTTNQWCFIMLYPFAKVGMNMMDASMTDLLAHYEPMFLRLCQGLHLYILSQWNHEPLEQLFSGQKIMFQNPNTFLLVLFRLQGISFSFVSFLGISEIWGMFAPENRLHRRMTPPSSQPHTAGTVWCWNWRFGLGGEKSWRLMLGNHGSIWKLHEISQD